MDKETKNYIITYFRNLMTKDEKLALNYHMYTYKTSNNPEMRRILTEKGWISSNPEIAAFLKNGYDEFELNVAQRIMTESSEKNCPQCHKLARTPYAKQCRYCGYNWHHITAKFKVDNMFQLTGRGFYLLGEIIEGEIHPGQWMDLTVFGLHKKIKIESVEFANRKNNGKPWNGIGLETKELTEDDKLYLKQKSSLSPIIYISQA